MPCSEIKSSYPTLIEAMRFMATSLDLKGNNKRIDDKSTGHIDPREVDSLIPELFVDRVDRDIGPHASEFISVQINGLKDQYIDFIKDYNADGLTRTQLVKLLNKSVFPAWIARVFTELHKEFGGPSVATLFVQHNKAVPLVLKWISKHNSSWNELLDSREKKDRDRVSEWIKGNEIPSSQSIFALKNIWIQESGLSVQNFENIQVLLLMARFVDSLRRSDQTCTLMNAVLLQLWQGFAELPVPFQKEVGIILSKVSSDFDPSFYDALSKLQYKLIPDISKDSMCKEDTRILLDYARAKLVNISCNPGIQSWLDWGEAKWHVFSGTLEEANNFYKKAFDAALYQGGINLLDIINQSLVVASSLEKADKVFLKRLKWAMLLFKYDIPSVTSPNTSNRFEDSIEEWEIRAWRLNFSRIFPTVGLFPGVQFDMDALPYTMVNSEDEVKPDFRYPNRKFKIGEGHVLKMPQLNWFIIKENYDVFTKLLEAGASPNVFSDSMDTPLQLSLQLLNVLDPSSSFDDRFFWRLAEFPYKGEVVNTRSQKKRSLPLILAVQSGDPKIVQKVIDMGADPNGRGQTDEQTALNVCLKLMALCKNPIGFMENQREMPETTEVLDSFRRHTGGAVGSSLDQMKAVLNQYKTDPLYQALTIAFEKRLIENASRLDYQSLMQIAEVLIKAGADVNAEHKSPFKGYTPLMLAAENNEHELFQLMLKHGGLPDKGYCTPERRGAITCWEIAEYFNSVNVLNLLKKSRLH